MKTKKVTKLYACGTINTDISIGATQVTFYTSIKELKKSRDCWKECGIIEVELNYKYVVKENWNFR